MFKKVKALLCGTAALLMLVGCGGGSSDGSDDFDQNTDPHGQGITMYVIGSHFNSWTPDTIKDNKDCAFVKDSSTGLYTIDLTITQEMIDAWCGFKFIATNSWSEQYGMEDLNWEACNAKFKEQYKNEDGSQKTKEAWHEGASNRSNVEAKTPGKFHIEYNPANFETETIEGVTCTKKFTITVE